MSIQNFTSKLDNIPKGTKKNQIEAMIQFVADKHGLAIEKVSFIPDFRDVFPLIERLGAHEKRVEEQTEMMKSEQLSERRKNGIRRTIEREQVQVRKFEARIRDKLGGISDLVLKNNNKVDIWSAYISFSDNTQVRRFEEAHSRLREPPVDAPAIRQPQPPPLPDQANDDDQSDGAEHEKHPVESQVEEDFKRLFEQMRPSEPEFPSDIIRKHQSRSACQFLWVFLGALWLIALMMVVSFVVNAFMIFLRIQAEHNIKHKKIMYLCPSDEEFVLEDISDALRQIDARSLSFLLNINYHFQVYRFYKNTQRTLYCLCRQNEADFAVFESAHPLIFRHCETFFIDSFFNKYAVLMRFVVILLSNALLESLVKKTLRLVPFRLKSSRSRAEVVLLAGIFLFNYICIYFLYTSDFVLSLIYKLKYSVDSLEVKVIINNRTVPEQFGDSILMLTLFDGFRGPIDFLLLLGQRLWVLYKSRKKIPVQSKMVKFSMPPIFELEARVAYLFTLVCVVFFFSNQIPLVALFGVFSLIPLFWAEKLNLIVFSRRPKLYSRLPMGHFIKGLLAALLLCVAYSIRVYGDPDVLFSSNFMLFPDPHYDVDLTPDPRHGLPEPPLHVPPQLPRLRNQAQSAALRRLRPRLPLPARQAPGAPLQAAPAPRARGAPALRRLLGPNPIQRPQRLRHAQRPAPGPVLQPGSAQRALRN